MPDKRAEAIVREYEAEENRVVNWRSLQQEVADLMLPRMNQITSLKTPGTDKSRVIYDPTAMLDLEDMVSGLSATFFPAGQRAFMITAKDNMLAERPGNKEWLALATQITHDELYDSNFMLQLNEVLSSLVGLGTGNLESMWDMNRLGLNYKAFDIARYTFKENNQGQVDTVYLKFPYTARQAFQEFGDRAGDEVVKAAGTLETESDVFMFIRVIRFRSERNSNLITSLNMPFESLSVNVKEGIIVDEGGYPEMPNAVCRWKKGSSEKYGRGQGMQILSAVKLLQGATKDWIDLANKYANPPLEVLDSVPGNVRTFPSAINRVMQLNSIRGIDQEVLGNFPVTEQAIERIQNVIHRAFFVDVFAPLANIGGEARMTHAEIMERIKTAMKKLALPVYRLQCELFNPTITRSVILLIRNGRIPMPPPSLQGQGFGLEYVGELALAMRDQQALAFQRFTQTIVALEPVFPGAKDMIAMDRALPDIAATEGLKVEHLATPEEVAAKRAARAQAQQAEQALAMASAVAEGYSKTQKSPEAGSPAGEVMEGL